MTFKEKLMQEHRENVSDDFYGGCNSCPHYFGYESIGEGLCGGNTPSRETECEACWNREMPEEPEAAPVQSAELHLTEDDIFCLAAVIYQEAGGDDCTDETRYMVADVVLNRVADERFPDSVRDVLEDAPGGCLQYGRFAITGVCFPDRAELESEKHAVQRAWYIAREIAAGEHSELYGNGYIWQAEFGQGTDQIWADGICFGR